MRKFKFKDWAGNTFFIKAKDMYKALDKAEKEITIKPFYLEHNIKPIYK